MTIGEEASKFVADHATEVRHWRDELGEFTKQLRQQIVLAAAGSK